MFRYAQTFGLVAEIQARERTPRGPKRLMQKSSSPKICSFCFFPGGPALTGSFLFHKLAFLLRLAVILEEEREKGGLFLDYAARAQKELQLSQR